MKENVGYKIYTLYSFFLRHDLSRCAGIVQNSVIGGMYLVITCGHTQLWGILGVWWGGGSITEGLVVRIAGHVIGLHPGGATSFLVGGNSQLYLFLHPIRRLCFW